MSEKTHTADHEILSDCLPNWGRALLQELKAKTASQSHELEAARAELDARKNLIESLRGDVERAQALYAQLEEKRKVISKLERYIVRHVSTLAEPQQSVSTWKEKYASPKSRNPSSESTIAPKLIEEELRAEEGAEDISEELMPRRCLCPVCVEEFRSVHPEIFEPIRR